MYDSRLVSKQTMHHLLRHMNHPLTKCSCGMLKCGWRRRLVYRKVTKSTKSLLFLIDLKVWPFYPASCGIQCSAVIFIGSSRFILAVSVTLTKLKIEYCPSAPHLSSLCIWCYSIFKARLEGYLQYGSC